MATGLTASIVVSATGLSASIFNGEVDVAIDAGGDLLAINSAGDPLMVTPAVTWTGGTASFVVADFSGALETEGWAGLETEAGQTIATEGS